MTSSLETGFCSCGLRWEDTLSLHIEKCKGTGAKPRPKQTLRVELSKDTRRVPRIIIIVRSSSQAPDSWYDSTGDLESGLYDIGRAILQEFRRMSNICAAAALHAGWNMKTRELPASEEYEDRFGDDDHHRVQKNNAYKWTNAINQDLRQAQQPIVVAAGWDGFSCNTTRITEWLPVTPTFWWIIRIPTLKYDADESLLNKREDVWWADFRSEDISLALASPAAADDCMKQCVRIMRQIQKSKDVRSQEHALFNGRNLISKSNYHSGIDTDPES
jgi:hypothetical protein